ncbi:NRDE family protein [Galbibacter sp. BG1]|uniref:NRDE family protein n=1 Tax=Galbibacter sp. BG1 TaxID=1170699 RepID=UPI0015BF3DB6|nr:NRDE family protein [Galbibacter sp. BG1]QLE00077.1 NRDE family protein [Galbibacter sp. BG1]
MCTVSYIPTSQGFYLTSNRDEDPLRETLPPQEVPLDSKNLLTAPIDKEKGGSWIATDNNGKVACILNGAFELHERKLPYAKSRGHYVLEAFQYPSFIDFMEQVELKNIEPFTLILIDNYLQVLVWDGVKKHMQFLSKELPHLWSSSTLYNDLQHKTKLAFFNNFLNNNEVNAASILKLHGTQDFMLNLPYVKTVSTTQVCVSSQETTLQYYPYNTKEENSIGEKINS